MTLIDVKISFSLNILRTNGHNSPNFVYALVLTRSKRCFCKLAEDIWPLTDVDWGFLYTLGLFTS